ncbi:hypothetical protein SLEP1_g13524 [Rubroshorea leprosula]|uniref:Uncharacterized protein n=1 Tax=Rubroshorea leprosula TaxID=152421 RepID=A0AAV5IG81_9ROSI|nr:hypothetical protein SLEP1_g13524 [Rubroshorea leprosula]
MLRGPVSSEKNATRCKIQVTMQSNEFSDLSIYLTLTLQHLQSPSPLKQFAKYWSLKPFFQAKNGSEIDDPKIT